MTIPEAENILIFARYLSRADVMRAWRFLTVPRVPLREATEPAQANAKLIVRLANLYFAGTERSKKHEAEVLANGDMPADPDYGLTENEIAAAQMLNALMGENAKLLVCLEKSTTAMISDDIFDNFDNFPDSSDDTFEEPSGERYSELCCLIDANQAVIAKATDSKS